MLNKEVIGHMNINQDILDRLDELYDDNEYNDMSKNLFYIRKTCELLDVELDKNMIEFILKVGTYSKNPSYPKTLYKLLSYDLFNLDMELDRKNFLIKRLKEVSSCNLKGDFTIKGIKRPKLESLDEEYVWVVSVYTELLGRSWGYYELSYLYDDAWKNKDKNSDMKIIYNIVNKTKLYTLNRCKEDSQGKEDIYLIDVEKDMVHNLSPWTSWMNVSDDKYIDQRRKAIKFNEIDEIVDLCSDDTIIIGKLSDLIQE